SLKWAVGSVDVFDTILHTDEAIERVIYVALAERIPSMQLDLLRSVAGCIIQIPAAGDQRVVLGRTINQLAQTPLTSSIREPCLQRSTEPHGLELPPRTVGILSDHTRFVAHFDNAAEPIVAFLHRLTARIANAKKVTCVVIVVAEGSAVLCFRKHTRQGVVAPAGSNTVRAHSDEPVDSIVPGSFYLRRPTLHGPNLTLDEAIQPIELVGNDVPVLVGNAHDIAATISLKTLRRTVRILDTTPAIQGI